MHPSPSEISTLLQAAGPDEQWVVLHTRPRCEKKLGEHSRLKDCRFYLPTIRRAHNYGRRVREYDVPFFNGYVFACVQKNDKAWFRYNPYVANVLEVLKEEPFLRVLRGVATALSEGMELEILPYLQPGKKVLITGGPMKGLEAVIAEVKGQNKVLLNLELIQQSVIMEIDSAYLKSAE